ncbi:MAG: hypothetical protein NVS1B11_35860 [Terriglobales bacterium]
MSSVTHLPPRLLMKSLISIFKHGLVAAVFARVILLSLPAQALPPSQTSEDSIANTSLKIAAKADGSFMIFSQLLPEPVIRASISFDSGSRWTKSTSYPKHSVRSSIFHDALGSGHFLEVVHSGLANSPDLVGKFVLYDNQPYGSIQVTLHNQTADVVNVEAFRVVDAEGAGSLQLGGPHLSERVLSDSYSEDRPSMRIVDFAKPPQPGVHQAVGSQIIFNRNSGIALFLASLSSERFLNILHLKVATSAAGPQVISYDVTSAGTTEIEKRESLRESPVADRVDLRIPVSAGGTLSSEILMFSVTKDYIDAMNSYGRAVRLLMHPRLGAEPPIGWWSWTAYYFGINQGAALTNAQWMAQHLRNNGYSFFHIDEGYQYARGEYTTADATQFPQGMEEFGSQVAHLGLRLGVWTAPFEVSERAWIFEHHKDWLVHNAEGNPIHLGFVNDRSDRLYALDTTNPEAQGYLRQTYKTLVEKWGVQYIKLDFMDDSAVEGFYHVPHTTALQAQRIGLKTIREAVGESVLLDKDGSPMLNPVGLVDAGRTSADTGHTFSASKDVVTGIAARFYMNGNFFISDPDAFTVSRQLVTDETWRVQKSPLTLDEAKVAIALAALSGGMFELGDDLPTLGMDSERLALVTNPDLLNMVNVGRAATPIDLMTYREKDELPSIFFLRQDNRHSILAVFNWTESETSHSINLSDLHLRPADSYQVKDIFAPDSTASKPAQGLLSVEAQPPHSVRLLKLIDASVSPTSPQLSIDVPTSAQLSAEVRMLAREMGEESSPAVSYQWDFGDGTGANGRTVSHAYTHPGQFSVHFTAEGLDGVALEKTFQITVSGKFSTRFAPAQKRRFVY